MSAVVSRVSIRLAQVRHGCIPVIIMDGVHMPFEGELNYSSFALRVKEARAAVGALARTPMSLGK